MMANARASVDQHKPADAPRPADDHAAIDEGSGADNGRARDDSGRVDHGDAAAESAPLGVLHRETPAARCKNRHDKRELEKVFRDIFGWINRNRRTGVDRAIDILHAARDRQTQAQAAFLVIDQEGRA